MKPNPIVVTERTKRSFWKRVAIRDVSECWEWVGSRASNGYGWMHSIDQRRPMAHRLSWIINRGPISEGLVVDHVCRNRGCVNPAHLRLVTPRQNALENSNGVSAKNSSKTQCARGHVYDLANTYLYDGGRECRKCRVINVAKYRRTHSQ